MKKFLLFFLVSLTVCSFLYAEAQQESSEKIEMKIGHIRDMEHPAHLGAVKFADLVSDYSDGRITVKVYPNSQLGGPEEMFTQLQTGDLEMVYGGINTMAWIGGGEPYEITSMPFLFRNYDHMRRALISDFFLPVQTKVEEDTGIKIVNPAGDTAPRGLSTNLQIKNVKDLQGLKIRTAASETALRLWKHFGALPEQIPYADLYMALRTGVVEAQENGALVVASKNFYEVQDYYIRTDYIGDIETFYMSLDLWNSLNPKDQELIMKASDEAGEYVTQLTKEKLDEAYDFLRTKITVIESPELDLDSFRNSVVGLFDDWDGVRWPKGLLESIKNLK